METERICPNCRKPLQPDVPLGLCPECLIKSGFPTESEPGTGAEGLGRFVPPPVEEVVRLFPQFEILGFIGKGGMGAVYKARQPALDRLVALKILPPAVANDPGFAERFNREARALARLSHPNIVVVYDFGKAGALHYLVMEFVDGTNLRDVEKAGRLSAEQALAIVPQICEALQFAHNEGVVHRDIKPENLLVDKKGRVKIADFGIAKILDVSPGKAALTGARDVVGTPHYMAPEQIEKPQAVDHRADIYSLGVVFYEMLTGELPLGKFAPPSKKVQVDVRLDEVVLHTLEKEPDRRYQQASQVKTDIETIAGTPPPAAAAGALPPVPGSRPEPASDKILLPTFLLALFFGVFGAHRFYVGKIGTGVLQLCTLGGLGIWAVIDWILILCKVFTDGNGRRITNWWHASARPPKPPKPAKPPGPETPPIISGAFFDETFGGGSLMIIAPALALMVSAFLKLFGALLVLLIGWPESGVGHSILSRIGIFAPFHDGPFFGAGIILIGLVPAVVMIYGAAEMIRYGNHAWAIAGAVAGIMFCSTLGFPAGLWALTILLLPSVREKFSGQHTLTADKWVRIFGGTAAAGLLLFLMMCFFGFLQTPTHHRNVVRLPEVINDQPAESSPAAPVAPTPPAAATIPASPAPQALPDMAPLPPQPSSSAVRTVAPSAPLGLDDRRRTLETHLNEAQPGLTNTEARSSIGTVTSYSAPQATQAMPGPRPSVNPTPAGTVSEPMAGPIVAVAPMPGSSPADVPADVKPVAVGAMGKMDPTNAASTSGNRIVLAHKVINAGKASDLTQSFDIGPDGKLKINVDRGAVRITGTDDNTVTIHLTRQVTGAGDSEAAQILNDERVVFTQDGNVISIKAQNPLELQHLSLLDHHPNLDAQYEITLPRRFDAHAETSGGDINVSNIQGRADVKTMGGRITCDDIAGDIRANTMGGDVRATECKGHLDLETMGGSVTIDGFAGPDVHATTLGGSVSAEFAIAPTRDSELKTSGGSITVQLPDNAALQLEGQTFAGTERSDFPIEINDRFGNGTLSGAINGGGPVLRMETDAGNVEIRKK